MKAVNLLPPDQRGAAKAASTPAASQSGSAGAYAVLGALAIGVVSVAGYVLTSNTVKEHEVNLAALTAREQALQAKVGDLKPYADFAQLAETRVATVKDLAGRRFDWENALRDLSRAIPANVTLKTLTGTVSPDSGAGGSSLRGAIAAPAISLTGCTTSQPQVAKLMARLRTVDGVTRVSLAKSTKPAQAAASSGAPATTPTGPTIGMDALSCGNGSPPEFEMVMFFERDAAASAAPTGAAGGAATVPASATTPAAAVTPAGDTAKTSSTPTEGTP
jgi:Tfp pilus assembly protein PilN